MIRKLIRMDAPPEVVHEMFRDTDEWPRWMPGITSTRTLESDEGSRRVEVIYLAHGRRLVQHLDCREVEDGLRHHQVRGWFKSWDATWTFRPADGGEATIVSLAVELELALAAGLLLPRRFLRGWMSRLLEETLTQGRTRAARLAERQREPTQAVATGQPLLQVFQTAEGYEVHFAGRTFLIDPSRAVAKP